MKKLSIILAAALSAASAMAYDGLHLISSATFASTNAGWDYVSYDAANKHVFLGHRKDGLQVYDPATQKIIKVVGDTASHSANGAAMAPEFDLGISNNEDGTYTPFKLSTLEAGASIKIAEGIDTSHYDTATKRFVFNTEPDAKGTHLLVMEAATQKVVGEILVPSTKAEGADADGAGNYYLVGQDRDEMYLLDTKALKLVSTWNIAAFCGKPTGVATDAVNHRVFVTCRGRDAVKPAFVVLDAANGSKVYSVEIGGGSDSLIYDAPTKRLYSANGVNANLSVIEQIDANNYKVVEHLGTEAWVRTMAMDHATGRLYAQTASGASDASKKILTAVSPYYINTIFPNTYRVLTYGK
jgi:hypothetical protein